MAKITDVAVAVFVRPDGSFLLSSRPEGKPYAGYWEFPGGKIESGETVLHALRRELIEELNVVIDAASPWFTFMMHYEHATVRLHTWRVARWHDVDATGMHGMEGQQFRWQHLNAMTVAPALPGCVPIFRALALPTMYAITNASEVGVKVYLEQLRALWSKNASNSAPNGEFQHSKHLASHLIQIREKSMDAASLGAFARDIVALAREHHAIVLINSHVDLAAEVGADGVHLTSAQLRSLDARPPCKWVGASVHDAAELALAAKLQCDFAVLGSVKPTLSHPGQPALGWRAFSDLVRNAPMPVFAIGGLHPHHLSTALEHGAHGIAMQRRALAN